MSAPARRDAFIVTSLFKYCPIEDERINRNPACWITAFSGSVTHPRFRGSTVSSANTGQHKIELRLERNGCLMRNSRVTAACPLHPRGADIALRGNDLSHRPIFFIRPANHDP